MDRLPKFEKVFAKVLSKVIFIKKTCMELEPEGTEQKDAGIRFVRSLTELIMLDRCFCYVI